MVKFVFQCSRSTEQQQYNKHPRPYCAPSSPLWLPQQAPPCARIGIEDARCIDELCVHLFSNHRSPSLCANNPTNDNGFCNGPKSLLQPHHRWPTTIGPHNCFFCATTRATELLSYSINVFEQDAFCRAQQTSQRSRSQDLDRHAAQMR